MFSLPIELLLPAVSAIGRRALNTLTSALPGSLNCGSGKSEQARGGGAAGEQEVMPVG